MRVSGDVLVAIAGISAEYFSPLLDRIAMAAALNGSLVGFDGRVLQVIDIGSCPLNKLPSYR